MENPDPFDGLHIVYCKTDGRMIAVTHTLGGAKMVYAALANSSAIEEDYEFKSLRQWYLECGYPADNIGERIMFADTVRPHPFTR